MIFNEQNIFNRTAIAKCCYADLIISMMEDAATGDMEQYSCKRRKAIVLSYAIQQMCEYISDGIYSLNQNENTEVKCFSNDIAKAFISQMDSVCGCPCGCSPSKILNDQLPKYI